MNEWFSFAHLNDLLTLIWLLIAMTIAYRPRVKLPLCAAWMAVCLGGMLASLMLQEKFFSNFGVYMLLFVLWGCVYGALALGGSFLWKTAMAAEYGCIVFHLGKIAWLISSLMPASLQQNQYAGRVMFQILALLCAWFLSRHAVTTARRVPSVCWGSLVGVSLIGVGFAYYQMMTDLGASINGLSVLPAMGVVAMVLVVANLCARLIRSHEEALVRLSLQQDGEGAAAMARQAGRIEEMLRRYRHETVNHLSTLSALLDKGETKKARELLAEIVSAPAPDDEEIHSGNVLVDALLAQKKAACQQQGIAFSADAVMTENLPFSDAELSSLLGNLLNNAMEGAAQQKNPFVRVRMYPARDYLCIEVVNRADSTLLRSNPALNTTKTEPELHGIGLRVVQQIVRRHQGMTNFSVGEDSFTARIMIHL